MRRPWWVPGQLPPAAGVATVTSPAAAAAVHWAVAKSHIIGGACACLPRSSSGWHGPVPGCVPGVWRSPTTWRQNKHVAPSTTADTGADGGALRAEPVSGSVKTARQRQLAAGPRGLQCSRGSPSPPHCSRGSPPQLAELGRSLLPSRRWPVCARGNDTCSHRLCEEQMSSFKIAKGVPRQELPLAAE